MQSRLDIKVSVECRRDGVFYEHQGSAWDHHGLDRALTGLIDHEIWQRNMAKGWAALRDRNTA